MNTETFVISAPAKVGEENHKKQNKTLLIWIYFILTLSRGLTGSCGKAGLWEGKTQRASLKTAVMFDPCWFLGPDTNINTVNASCAHLITVTGRNLKMELSINSRGFSADESLSGEKVLERIENLRSSWRVLFCFLKVFSPSDLSPGLRLMFNKRMWECLSLSPPMRQESE